MHVCHFCETSVEGAYFKNIAKGLIARGAKVSLLELGPRNPPTWLDEVPDAKYFCLNVTGRAGYPLAVWKLAGFLGREDVDILHTHLYNSGLIAAAARFLHRKTVYAYMRHHTSVVRILGSAVHVRLDRWMAEHSDHLLAVANAVRDYMREKDGIRGDIDVVYLGFDFDKFSPNAIDRKRVRDEFGFTDENFVIGYVANFAPGKGHIELLNAFASVAEKIPKSRVLLVGSGRLQEVDDAVGRLGLGRKIAFAGWRNDTSACLNAMDVFVQPSLSEAFSQVLVEAMGVGLPVIATDVGGASEVIDNGKNGILIAPDDIDAISESVLNIRREPNLRTRIAKAGRESVRENFTVERMIDTQFGLYEMWLKR